MEKVLQRVKKFMKQLKGTEGVTLIELLAVVVILAIVAAVAVPAVLGQISKSKVNADKQNEQVIVDAIQRMVLDEASSGANNIAITQSDDFTLPSSTKLETLHVDTGYVSGSSAKGSAITITPSLGGTATPMTLDQILTQGLPGSSSTPYLSQWPSPQSASGSWLITGYTTAPASTSLPANSQTFTIGTITYVIAP